MVLSLGRGFVAAVFLELMAHWLGRGSRPQELGGRRALSSEGKALQTTGERQEGALDDWRRRSLQVTARARVERRGRETRHSRKTRMGGACNTTESCVWSKPGDGEALRGSPHSCPHLSHSPWKNSQQAQV